MVNVDIIESLGGTSRFITVMTFFIHFLHPLFCVATYIHWVRNQKHLLGSAIVDAHLAFCIIASIFYLFVASVFYMWAWRFPEPEEVSKRRRIYGIVVNLLFSDIPLFVIETKIVWELQFADGLQGFTYVLTCISLFYSTLRVWTFFMVKLIKIRAPVVGAQSHFAGSRSYPGPYGRPPGAADHYGPGGGHDYPALGASPARGYSRGDDYALRGYSPESAGQGSGFGDPGVYPGGAGGRGYPSSSYSGGPGAATWRGGNGMAGGADYHNQPQYGHGGPGRI